MLAKKSNSDLLRMVNGVCSRSETEGLRTLFTFCTHYFLVYLNSGCPPLALDVKGGRK
jgi:hypothetical protein